MLLCPSATKEITLYNQEACQSPSGHFGRSDGGEIVRSAISSLKQAIGLVGITIEGKGPEMRQAVGDEDEIAKFAFDHIFAARLLLISR